MSALQKVDLATAVGTWVATIEAPITDGKRPRYLLVNGALYAHHLGRTLIQRAQYRRVGDVVQITSTGVPA